MQFTLIEIFPLKEPEFPLKEIMLDWQKKKGTLLEYSKTKHYIFFDVDNACVRVMPMSFDGGFMPHERMIKAFPFGFKAEAQNIKEVDYHFFIDTHDCIKPEISFTYKGISFPNVVFVGKQFNNSIAALTLNEVISFLANTVISDDYECVMFYPPA